MVQSISFMHRIASERELLAQVIKIAKFHQTAFHVMENVLTYFDAHMILGNIATWNGMHSTPTSFRFIHIHNRTSFNERIFERFYWHISVCRFLHALRAFGGMNMRRVQLHERGEEKIYSHRTYIEITLLFNVNIFCLDGCMLLLALRFYLHPKNFAIISFYAFSWRMMISRNCNKKKSSHTCFSPTQIPFLCAQKAFNVICFHFQMKMFRVLTLIVISIFRNQKRIQNEAEKTITVIVIK